VAALRLKHTLHLSISLAKPLKQCRWLEACPHKDRDSLRDKRYSPGEDRDNQAVQRLVAWAALGKCK
jgi:hypothetical protein